MRRAVCSGAHVSDIASRIHELRKAASIARARIRSGELDTESYRLMVERVYRCEREAEELEKSQ